ncbi:hypothetical protein FB451DRAFT_1398831 [Mycena latifolia]|nr:hypothetical protein FB451DRAFT_1398831 [Mycena latifolia]
MTSRGGLEPKTRTRKEHEILSRYPLADHWRTPSRSGPFGGLRWAVFNVLCMASYGHAGMDRVWASIKLEEEGDESLWVEGLGQMCDRLNTILLVGSLLLATSAAFMTTSPPRAAMINYTLRGPYICMLNAFGLLIGAIIVAAIAYLVLTRATPNWSKRVLYASRFHVYSTLIILSYPLFSIVLATLFLGLGILTAMWWAEDRALQIFSPVILVMPISIGVLFGVSWGTATPEYGKDSVIASSSQRIGVPG